MTNEPDHYALLGLAPDATPEDIKRAYRTLAKQAHPDAGGSAEAMQRLTASYAVLSDEASRRQYDRLRTSATHAPGTGDPPDVRAKYEAQAERMQNELHRRLRRAQARASAWRLLKNSAVAAVLLSIITRFMAAAAPQSSAKITLEVIGFVPVYCVLLAFIFLISPKLRLDIYDAIHGPRHHLDRADYWVLAALVLAFIPVAAAWIAFT